MYDDMGLNEQAAKEPGQPELYCKQLKIWKGVHALVLIDLKTKRLQERYKGSQLLRLSTNEPWWLPGTYDFNKVGRLSKAQSLRGIEAWFVRTSSVESFLRGRQQAIRPLASIKGEDTRIVFIVHSLTGRGSDCYFADLPRIWLKSGGGSTTPSGQLFSTTRSLKYLPILQSAQ